MKISQLLVVLMLVSIIVATANKNKGKAHGKNKQRNRNRNKKYNSDKVLKRYTFENQADEAAAADGKAADGKAGDAKGDAAKEDGASTEDDAAEAAAKAQAQLVNQMNKIKAKTQVTKGFVEGALANRPTLVMEGGETLPTDYEQLEATKECELKQGYLALVTSISTPVTVDSSGLAQPGAPVINAKSTFAVLNKQSLSFFDKEQVNSLIKNIDITHLKPSYQPTKFGDLKCFQLVAAAQVQQNLAAIIKGVDYLPTEQVLATICTQSEDKMNEWANAIQTFHNCNVQVSQDQTETKTTQLDILSARRTTLRKRAKAAAGLNQEVSDENDENEQLMIKNQVENIKKAVLKEKSDQAVAKRQMTIKLENDIKDASEMVAEQECVQKTQQIQEEEEEKAVENLIQAESQTRESKELEKKKDNIIKMLKKQGEQIQTQENELDSTINKMTKAMQYNMVQSVQNYEKVLDPTMCYLADYGFPSDIKTKQQKQQYVCTRMIDPQDMDIESINDCLIPQYFCDVCCNYNIGKANEVGREKCVTQCANKLVGGEGNMFTINYTLVQNLEKINRIKAEKKQKAEEEQQAAIEAAKKEAGITSK